MRLRNTAANSCMTLNRIDNVMSSNTGNSNSNICVAWSQRLYLHDDIIKWKHFPRYWPFVRGIHWSPVNSPHRDQWCGALMFSLICALKNGWVNNRGAGDLTRHRAHCDVIVMESRPDYVHISTACRNTIFVKKKRENTRNRAPLVSGGSTPPANI